MERREWLDGLKEGDAVIVSNRHGETVRKVERFTPTLVVLEGGRRFNRQHGGETGGSVWDVSQIQEATPERLQELRALARRRGMVRLLSDTKWDTLSLETLEAVYRLVTPAAS